MPRHDGRNVLDNAMHPETGQLLWPMARDNGVSETTFRARLRSFGVCDADWSFLSRMSPAAAARIVAPVKGCRVLWPYLEAAFANGIPAATFRFRVQNGWPIERALSEPVRGRGKAKRCDPE